MHGANRVCALVAACAVSLGATSAPPAEATTDALPLPPEIAAIGLDAAQLALWNEALALERSELFQDSNQRYEALAAAHPGSPFLAWRIARNYWRYGDQLPATAKEERHTAFRRSNEWAERSLAMDPRCGECVLWTMASMGRLAMVVGPVSSARMAKPIADLIERGIALQPTTRDNEWNTTLGNLYFSASAFYRLLPEWTWLEYMIGVRGDKERALDFIQRAVAISPQRVDYHVELGAVLACLGVERGDDEALARARNALARARALPRLLGTDAMDQQNAALLLEHPDRACSYSRDGVVDFSGVAQAGLP
jgi:tetratricopeptide (TPR) repeat protein